MQPYQTHRMRWSWPLARIAGIQVSVHLTFFLLLLWIALGIWQQTHSTTAMLQGVAFVLALFTCVVLHEFGHALTARRFGIQTRGITLLPIGGVAQLERMPQDPWQEILVAIAGPAVNVVIASALFVLLSGSGFSAAGLTHSPDLLFASTEAFLYNIMLINMVLAIFNLVPAFPMDGGRVLRAALALFMPHHLATQRAAGIGQMLAMMMFITGLLYNPLLMLVSAFIWLAAAGEAGAESLQHSLRHVKAEDLMNQHMAVLQPDDTLARAIDLTIHQGHQHFPVSQPGNRFVLLTHDQLLAATRNLPETTRVAELDLPVLPICRPETGADQLLQSLQGASPGVAGVMAQGQLLGLVPLSSLSGWLALHGGQTRA